MNNFRSNLPEKFWSDVSSVQAFVPRAPRNIVLVHGAFVDGSGWQPVYDLLVQDGYHVTLVQQPLTSLEEDVAAARRILDRQDGPCILVAHSYGGTVITEAGTHPKVSCTGLHRRTRSR